jgi:zinc transporter ZupT
MAGQKICENCYHKQNCQEIYKKLGNSKGRSVVLKVLIAFLLPLLVFIGCLAGFEGILAKIIKMNNLEIVLNFLLAVVSAGVCVLIIRAISHCCENEEPEEEERGGFGASAGMTKEAGMTEETGMTNETGMMRW